ncbi:hypothetical protein GBAR_LOCUS8108 [Geodia barretti]|uniref:Uncharacterized protein n=1 Tax=Geodia barretti TaxID=519541 RepID=A0AA35RMA4_GEOBA|nr:hypothetical protein GBAR_LOCUS8108 [Geodia barretti]
MEKQSDNNGSGRCLKVATHPVCRLVDHARG